MKAAIVAGGGGTRMGAISEITPKPMLPIGRKPILEHQIELLVENGIREITLCTKHLSPVIEDYFGNGKKWSASIRYSVENTPLGTAGGIRLAFPEYDRDILVLYGDVMLYMDLEEMIRRHFSSGVDATLAVHSNDHPGDSDLISVDRDFRILRFHSKPHPKGVWLPNLTNAAVYILGPEIRMLIPEGESSDFGHDIFPDALSRGYNLLAYRTAEYIKDAGTPARYQEVNADWKIGNIIRLRRKNPRPAVFLDRDGVLIEEVGHLSHEEDLRLIPGAAEAVKQINASGYLAIVATNQPVIARGICSFKKLQIIHNKLETLLSREGARLDAIYYCPHHPDGGYPGEIPELKIICNCRKPAIGMIEQAQSEFNIDLNSSWMVGDTTVDLETARRAGIKSVLVETGYAGKDGRFPNTPDKQYSSLLDAINETISPLNNNTKE